MCIFYTESEIIFALPLQLISDLIISHKKNKNSVFFTNIYITFLCIYTKKITHKIHQVNFFYCAVLHLYFPIQSDIIYNVCNIANTTAFMAEYTATETEEYHEKYGCNNYEAKA